MGFLQKTLANKWERTRRQGSLQFVDVVVKTCACAHKHTRTYETHCQPLFDRKLQMFHCQLFICLASKTCCMGFGILGIFGFFFFFPFRNIICVSRPSFTWQMDFYLYDCVRVCICNQQLQKPLYHVHLVHWCLNEYAWWVCVCICILRQNIPTTETTNDNIWNLI